MIEIRHHPSPNCNERRNGLTARYVVLHFTALGSAQEAVEFLCDPEREVSAHYVLGQDGDVTQLVDEAKRAWHAGASYWHGITDMNSASIGIEIDNNGGRPFTDAQYETLIVLLRQIMARHDIPPINVIGHSDIAPGRKFDPGPWFDWHRLYAPGVSAPPKGHGRNVNEALTTAGYNPDVEQEIVLMSMRLRYGATPYFGPARAGDLALLTQKL